jgi:hypothetical protein
MKRGNGTLQIQHLLLGYVKFDERLASNKVKL